MASSMRVNLDGARIASEVTAISKSTARRGGQKVRDRAEQNVRSAGRVDTGKMAGGIQVRDLTADPNSARVEVVSTAPHSAFQEFGTRAHGPRNAKAMRFQIRGRGPVIFATWVRGVTPLHFMKRAADSLTTMDFVR